ncbi:enhancer of polycomb-like protein, partial [Tanacetum coccineum]
NLREQKIFSYYSFSKVRYSSWQHLDSEFWPHCSFTKQLSLPEYTYYNIKLLEGGSQKLPLPSSDQTTFEGFRKKSNLGVVSMLGSSRLSIPVLGSRSSTIYSLKRGNLPPFALSFNVAPNFFLSLHLKLLLERSINSFSLHDHDSIHSFDPSEDTMHPHVDDCSPPGISLESSSKSDESLSSLEAAGKDASLESVDGSQGNLTKLIFDGDFNVNRTSISSKAAQTVPVNIENSDKCTCSSNLNGISVEIPTSEEIYRDSQRTHGSRQVSDLTWNLNDGIIRSPNPTAPRSVWHRHKSGPSSSPFGDPSSSPFRDSLHSMLGFNCGNSRIDIFRNDISTIHQATGHVLPMPGTNDMKAGVFGWGSMSDPQYTLIGTPSTTRCTGASSSGSKDVQNYLDSVCGELKEELKEEVKVDLKEEMKADLKEEMKNELKEQMREELIEEMLEELKEEMHAEIPHMLVDYGINNRVTRQTKTKQEHHANKAKRFSKTTLNKGQRADHKKMLNDLSSKSWGFPWGVLNLYVNAVKKSISLEFIDSQPIVLDERLLCCIQRLIFIFNEGLKNLRLLTNLKNSSKE